MGSDRMFYYVDSWVNAYVYSCREKLLIKLNRVNDICSRSALSPLVLIRNVQGGDGDVIGNTTVTLPISYSNNSYCVFGPGLYIAGVCQQDITKHNDSFSASYVQQYQMCGNWNWVTIGV